MNVANQYLLAHGETVDDYDGVCGELANAIEQPGDDRVYVEGDIPWRYHMAMMRDGLVHDAWCEGDALPLHDWLTAMFGPAAWVDVTVYTSGEDERVYRGLVISFSIDQLVVEQ